MSAGLEWRIVVCVLAAAVGMSEARDGPYLRSNLARAMYNRMRADERLRNMNMSKVRMSVDSYFVYCLIYCHYLSIPFRYLGNKVV